MDSLSATNKKKKVYPRITRITRRRRYLASDNTEYTEKKGENLATENTEYTEKKGENLATENTEYTEKKEENLATEHKEETEKKKEEPSHELSQIKTNKHELFCERKQILSPDVFNPLFICSSKCFQEGWHRR